MLEKKSEMYTREKRKYKKAKKKTSEGKHVYSSRFVRVILAQGFLLLLLLLLHLVKQGLLEKKNEMGTCEKRK